MKKVLAGILALAWAGCLENPYPDSRLGWEKNVKKVSWTPRGHSQAVLDLTFTRTPEGNLSLAVRGAQYDSVELVAYIARYSPTYPPSLGTPFPNRFEFHGLARDPGAIYAPIAEAPDGTNGADLRDHDAGLILLRTWGGGARENGWGGVFSGTCTDPLRHTVPPFRGRLTGYIDADGYFCFRCHASESDPGSLTTGRIGEDSALALLYHGDYGNPYWNVGLSDTLDAEPRFTWRGDTLSATFHWEGWGEAPDSSHIEAVRVPPSPGSLRSGDGNQYGIDPPPPILP